MIKHYLKVALRNLLNYKAHSLISVICLAVGITCFSVANHFINSVTDSDELPNPTSTSNRRQVAVRQA